MSKKYECYLCHDEVRFDKNFKDEDGKSIPLSMWEDIKHECKKPKLKQPGPRPKTIEDYDYSKPLETQGQDIRYNTHDKLDDIFDLQNTLDVKIIENSTIPIHGAEQMVSKLATAIIHEAVELQRLTHWKWWKQPGEFDKTKAIEELIDIWHFVVSATLTLKLTPYDLLKEYKRKNQINHERQESGY